MPPPIQVSPDGSLISAPSGTRGLLMGNRGMLLPHHYKMQTPFAKATPWITCVLRGKNNLPLPKTDVNYTRLFILDEVTAFAAGHRPCGQCQRERYMEFVEIWCKVNSQDGSMLDDRLYAERCDLERHAIKRKEASTIKELPNGTMVQISPDGQPHLLLWGKLFPWSAGGYGVPIAVMGTTVVHVLTPTSIVKMLRAGFPLALNAETTVHPSVVSHLG